MDAFTEQLITKKKAGKEWAMLALAALLAVVVLAVSVLLFLLLPTFPFLAFGVLIGGGYGVFMLYVHQNVEFEYIVTNGDIDVDRIVGRRTRKRIVSVAGRKIETFEPYKAEAVAARHYDRVVMAASSETANGLWIFSYRSKKNGHTVVIFEPNDKVKQELLSGLSRPLALEIKQKYAL